MMKILTLGNETLRQQASGIEAFDDELKQLAEDMIHTMHEADGIGLAGPQVGVMKKIFVTHVKGDQPRVFVNPEIIETSLEVVDFEEGCLSVPGAYADVTRPEIIKIQAKDQEGKLFKLTAEGLLARVILHEADHLKGVLFIDHLTEAKRQRLVKLYEKRWRG